MSKYVSSMDGERYNNKLLTILKNDISIIYCKDSD